MTVDLPNLQEQLQEKFHDNFLTFFVTFQYFETNDFKCIPKLDKSCKNSKKYKIEDFGSTYSIDLPITFPQALLQHARNFPKMYSRMLEIDLLPCVNLDTY